MLCEISFSYVIIILLLDLHKGDNRGDMPPANSHKIFS